MNTPSRPSWKCNNGTHIIGVGSNSIFLGGGANVIYTAIAAIYAAYMNISKVSRVKYWGPWPPAPRVCSLYISILGG